MAGAGGRVAGKTLHAAHIEASARSQHQHQELGLPALPPGSRGVAAAARLGEWTDEWVDGRGRADGWRKEVVQAYCAPTGRRGAREEQAGWKGG